MKRALPYLAIMAAGTILFIPFLGRVHLFDWDEINFAESAREMIVTGDYSRVMIDYKPFWEKPPLFFWLQAASMKIFGINEFAARFPNAVCGIITLCLIFFLGRKYFDDTFGWLWVLAYIGSILPHFYFKSGIIDPWFNLFIFSAIVSLIRAGEHDGDRQGTQSAGNFSKFSIPVALAGFFSGLSILTKGPAGVFIICISAFIYTVSTRRRHWIRPPFIITYLFFIFISFIISYAIINHESSGWLPFKFFKYQFDLLTTPVAGHSGPFYYHIIVLLFGCFPASFIALSGFLKNQNAGDQQAAFRRWMLILFAVVLVLFSIVKTKIIHYSSLCYLPLTFLAAWEIHHRLKNGESFSKALPVFLLITGLIIGAAAALLPIAGNNPDWIIPYIKDSFARANLEADVSWKYGWGMIGIAYMVLTATGIFRWRKHFLHGAIILFTATALFIQAVLFSFIPRIEQYTQGAPIDFYKSLEGKDVYVEVLGFKSYAHLFYTKKSPQKNPNNSGKDWLLNGPIDKPAYFVCKVNKAKEYSELPQLNEIGRKNGFVFFERNVEQE